MTVLSRSVSLTVKTLSQRWCKPVMRGIGRSSQADTIGARNRALGSALRISIFILFITVPAVTQAADYHCEVKKKFDTENVYSQVHIQKYRYSVLVEERGASANLSRCSFAPSVQKITCDRYEANKVVFDEHVKLKKYYQFRSQFNVQIFADLSFIENNGRGGIAFGTCKIMAP